jgi:hypothetical protein
MAKEKSDKAEIKQNWFAKHKVLTVIGIFILLIIIVGASSGSKKPTATTTSKASTPAPAAAVGLNQPANDGKFSFTVTGFTCGQTEITAPDNAYMTSQAQGQFCNMNVTVKNIGSVAQALDQSYQYVYDSSNKQYSASSDATTTANSPNITFAEYQTINPGVTVSGIIVFDVPEGVTPATAMLHDSVASGGVKVNLQ